MSLLYLPSRSDSLEVDWNDPLNKGLVAWWPFRQNGGNTLRDVAGENHGTLTNMDSDDWVAGTATKSRALDFDGSNGYGQVPFKSSYRNYPLTVSFWLNRSLQGPPYLARDVLGFGFAGNIGTGWSVYTDSDNPGSIKYSYMQSGSNYPAFRLSFGNPSAAAWHHFLFTVDGSGEARYLNGKVVASSGWTGTPTQPSNTGDVYLCANSGLSTFRQALLSDVRVYNRALNAAEVHDLYVASRRGYPTQFKRRKIFLGATVEAAPTTTTTGGIITTRSPSPVSPSYKSGYARSAAESAYPELWDGLVGAWVPGLCPKTDILDLSGHGQHATAVGTVTSGVNGGEHCLQFADSSTGRCDFTPNSALIAAGQKAELTVTVRGRHTSFSTNFIFSLGLNSFNDYLLVQSLSNDFIRIIVDGGITGSTIQYTRNKPYQNYSFVLNSTETKSYVNGELAGTVSGTWSGDTWDRGSLNGWARSSYSNGNQQTTAVYLVHDRQLSPNEIALLHRDPLAPFRKRRKLIFSTQAAATPSFNAFWASRATVVAPPINIGGF